MAPFETTEFQSFNAVPASDWELINRRAGLMTVGLPMGALYYDQFSAVANLPDLLAECETWTSTIWPSIPALAGRLQAFARSLAAFLETVEGGHGQVAILEVLQADAVSCAADTHSFTTALAAFAAANNSADASPQRKHYADTFGDLNPSTDAVGAAAAALLQGLGSVQDDIAEGLKALAGAGHDFGGFMSKIELATAVADWKAVAAAFDTTIATLDQAERELTGAARYDGVPIEDGGTYYLRNVRPYDMTFSLLAQSNGLGVIQYGLEDPDPTTPDHQWAFTKTGWGYWTITSKDPTFAGQALSATYDDGFDRAFLVCMENFVGQQHATAIEHGALYRVEPVGGSGGAANELRLVNAAVELATQSQQVVDGLEFPSPDNGGPGAGGGGLVPFAAFASGPDARQTWAFVPV